MDLSKLNAATTAPKGVAMKVVDPRTDEPLFDEMEGGAKQYVTITLLSSDSNEYKRVSHKVANRKLKKITARGRIPKLTAEETENDQLDLLVACTLGWENVVYEGQPLEFNPENVRMLYSKVPVIREQVDAFIGDRANFLGN